MPSPSRAAPQIKRARTEASRAREQKAGVGASDVSRPGAHAAPSLQARFGSGGAHLQVEGSAGGAVSSTLWWSEVIHRRAVRCVVDNVLEGRKYARVAKEAKESERYFLDLCESVGAEKTKLWTELEEQMQVQRDDDIKVMDQLDIKDRKGAEIRLQSS